MRALVLEGDGSLAARDVPQPDAEHECLICVRMAGICGTDLQLLAGYAGFRGIPGHEFVGTVERVPPDTDPAWVGRRVVGEINVGCGACGWCRADGKEHCPARTVVGIRGREGAFAEYLSLPAANLHALPDAVDDRAAVFVEPTAAACRILEQVALDARSRVAVLGDGRLGLLIGQVLRTAAPDVTVLGRHDRKMTVARTLGVPARRRDADDAGRFDVVVEATGRGAGLSEALALVRPRGVVVLKSTVHGEPGVATWPAIVNEVTLVGSRCGPFRPAIDLLARGAVQTAPLVSRVAALDDYASAFADARGGLKVLLQP